MEQQWSLLVGGLLRAADMPGLERQVVPRAEDLERVTRGILQIPVEIQGGQSDPSVHLWFNDDPQGSAPRRYSVSVPGLQVSWPQLFDALSHAVQRTTPLPSGVVSNWTVLAALEDSKGRRIAVRTIEIPQGGWKRAFPTTTAGALMGGTIGAYTGGPAGALAGLVIGGATGAAYGIVVDSTSGRPQLGEVKIEPNGDFAEVTSDPSSTAR